MPLQTVAPQRLYRQIAGQLRSLIEAGEFLPGARLPAERDLAQQLGVSRPSVREALIALEVEGWIEVRCGSGVVVLARNPSEAAASAPPEIALADEEWGPFELISARRVVEGEIAALAATTQANQARSATLAALDSALESMRVDAAQGVLPLEGDSAFHAALAAASGNAVLLDTVERYWQSRRGPLYRRLGGYFETVHSWNAAIAEHEAILKAVKKRDAVAARLAMHQHMDKAHERLSVGWSQAHNPVPFSPKPQGATGAPPAFAP